MMMWIVTDEKDSVRCQELAIAPTWEQRRCPLQKRESMVGWRTFFC